jgi:hypothetical protein
MSTDNDIWFIGLAKYQIGVNTCEYVIISITVSAGTATGYGLDDLGSIPGRGKIFSFP